MNKREKLQIAALLRSDSALGLRSYMNNKWRREGMTDERRIAKSRLYFSTRSKLRKLEEQTSASERRRLFDMHAEDYARILRADPCAYCGGAAGAVDHIVAVFKGGDSDWMNLTAACKRCNSKKGTRSLLAMVSGLAVGT